MDSLPLRRLFAGPVPPGRVFHTNIWFRGHNNRRYEELIPRLRRVDPYLFVCSDRPALRGLQFRALYASRPVRYPLVLRAAARRYRFLLAPDVEQIPHFPGRVVADLDDPTFTPREVELLGRPNVAAYVVTAERAGRRLEELGVRTPYAVIPQGVSLDGLAPDAVAAAAARRRDGEVVVGYMAAWLLVDGDRGGENALYNVEHLLELWDEIHGRVPEARLWLVGAASEQVRARLAGRDDVLLLGRLAPPDALAHTAAFDVALYPRTKDQGIRSVKVAEYMAAGVPTVAYDYEVTDELRETGAGVLVGSPRDFVDAVVRLVREPDARAPLAAAAGAQAAARDWEALSARYAEVLDRYLV